MLDVHEIYNVLRFYEILKKDAYTLLVKKSKSLTDYAGYLDFYENTVNLHYAPSIDSTFDFIQAMIKTNWYSVIHDMIRRDIQLWEKNQDITNISLVFDLPRERVSFTVHYKKNITKS